jgi:hypothetical protein
VITLERWSEPLSRALDELQDISTSTSNLNVAVDAQSCRALRRQANPGHFRELGLVDYQWTLYPLSRLVASHQHW